MALRIGLIGGTGLDAWTDGETVEIETEYGNVFVTHTHQRNHHLFFLPRHGRSHERPPHRINYRANVQAFRDAHVDYVVGIFNVGSLRADLPRGTWVLPADFLDFTRQRARTFHDGDAFHVDVSEPFCPATRYALLATATRPVHDGGVYAAVEGPRFESAAEIQALKTLGADVVGMTGVPEATLAREAGLCYAALAYVANAPRRSPTPLDPRRIQHELAGQRAPLRRWLEGTFAKLPSTKKCPCQARARMAPLVPARRRTA